MKIKLRKSEKVAVVDDRDSDLARKIWSWHSVLGVIRYDAERYDPDKRRTPQILLAREITNAWSGWRVIHVDGDRLNNRRSNLLMLSPAQYGQYVRKPVGSSGYIGVRQKSHSFDVRIASEHIGNFIVANNIYQSKRR